MKLSALTRYRIMAYVTGTVLVVLCVVALPLQYAAGKPQMGNVGWPIHGFLFIVYVLAALNLALKRRWPLLHTALVVLAGTIPFLTFFMERRVAHEEAPTPAQAGDSVAPATSR